MAKKAKKIETAKGSMLEIVNPNAAGIDISNAEMQVCVPKDRDKANNRKFGAYTRDLKEIAEWLVKCGIETVAMESTGVYWLGIYKILLEYGIDVVLTDAASVKNYKDRKTDENDAAWLMTLHSYGLVKPCHQLENFSRSIRNIYRHRQSLIRDMTQAINRIHKALTQMNIKLSVALSNITGKSGIAIIEAIIKGERDPHKLSALASDRCKKSKDEIALSLEGTWEEDLLFVLDSEYDHFKFITGQIEACDKKIESMLMTYSAVTGPEAKDKGKKLKRSKKKSGGNTKVSIDIEKYCYQLWGVNLMAVPGFSSGIVLGLFAELGPNFMEKFETQEQFCSWCNLAPNTKVSGGKVLSSRVPKRYNPVGQIFRMAAGAVHSTKDPLGNYYRRLKSKGGPTFAHVATAHKMAKIFYNMVKSKVEYDGDKIGPDERTLLERKILREQRKLDRLIRRQKENAA